MYSEISPTLELEILQSSRAPFNPWDFENPDFAFSNDIFLLVQECCYLPCNLLIVWLVIRNPQLINNPPNILYVSVVTHNTLFLIQCLLVRIAVIQAGGAWTQTLCDLYAYTTVYFFAISTTQVLFLALERLITVILERKIKRRFVYLAIFNCHMLSGVIVFLHTLDGSKNVLSLSGEFCYPTAIGLSWAGICGLIIMLISFIATLGVYGMIVVHIRRSMQAVMRASPHLPDPGHAPSPPIKQRSSMMVASQSVIVSSHSESAYGAATAAAIGSHLRHVAVSSKRSQLERRVALRGFAVALGFGFTFFPYIYMVWFQYTTKLRTPAAFDRVYTGIKMTTEGVDPFILILLDTRFSGAAREMFAAWADRIKRLVSRSGQHQRAAVPSHECTSDMMLP
ncbi:hypothetical protein BC828DRAFT_388643 [Blastocladiella britannica]|nr:hypothetical protein BC828DRAFT_388643 [Blastocladiella britannica]